MAAISRRTPTAIVAPLNAEIVAALQAGGMREQLTAMGIETATSTPAELRDYIKAEIDKWTRVVKDRGAKPEQFRAEIELDHRSFS